MGTTPAATPAPAPAAMFDLQMKSLHEYVRAFNKHDAKAVAALYAQEAAFIERGDIVSAGSDSIESSYRTYFDAFPDAATSITRSWHRGDIVLFEYIEGGTNSGPHPAHKPTGKKVGYMGASVLQFKPDGLVRLDTTFYDELTKEVQAGWAPKPLAKMEVRPVMPVPAATDSWEVHKVTDADAAQTKAIALKKSLYSKFALRSEKDFLAALSDDVVLSTYDDPKDAKGPKEAGALFKDWMRMFSDGVVDASDGWSVDGYVVLLGTFSGKHVGAWGPLKATNKPFKSHFLDIARVNKDQKIDRMWSYANNYELLNSLGFYKDRVFEVAPHDPMNPN
jgi:ketosteroid isomerase-like protein